MSNSRLVLGAVLTACIAASLAGPATAQAAWVDRFIAHCIRQDVPVDFVSTHIYPNDTALNVFGKDEDIPQA